MLMRLYIFTYHLYKRGIIYIKITHIIQIYTHVYYYFYYYILQTSYYNFLYLHTIIPKKKVNFLLNNIYNIPENIATICKNQF